MKQLLLLFAIHFMIFYQQGKDKKEKYLVTLEKKNVVSAKPQKRSNFLFHTHQIPYDSLNFSPLPGQIAYNFADYSYLRVKQ